jgi:hypothetical protein
MQSGKCFRYDSCWANSGSKLSSSMSLRWSRSMTFPLSVADRAFSLQSPVHPARARLRGQTIRRKRGVTMSRLNAMSHSSWQDLYRAAINESDSIIATERIDEAQRVITCRARDLFNSCSGSIVERHALDEAFYSLSILKSYSRTPRQAQSPLRPKAHKMRASDGFARTTCIRPPSQVDADIVMESIAPSTRLERSNLPQRGHADSTRVEK